MGTWNNQSEFWGKPGAVQLPTYCAPPEEYPIFKSLRWVHCQLTMGWKGFCILPLFCFTILCDASSFPALSHSETDTSNNPPQICQISPFPKTNIKKKNYVDVKQPEATILKSSSTRVKKELMKLNLFDIPRALVWLLNQLKRRRALLSKEMIPRHLPAFYTRADLRGLCCTGKKKPKSGSGKSDSRSPNKFQNPVALLAST